jgi:hypothetical protein
MKRSLVMPLTAAAPGNAHLKCVDPSWNGERLQWRERYGRSAHEKNVKHVWNESGGGHSWPNWQVYLSKYAPLLFRD